MRETLRDVLCALRNRLDDAFSAETCCGAWNKLVPSTGHCAVVALVVRDVFGGELVSARPMGVSHWFNRIHIGDCSFDVDLTGDQFGRLRVQLSTVGDVWANARKRSLDDVNAETRHRYDIFVARLR